MIAARYSEEATARRVVGASTCLPILGCGRRGRHASRGFAMHHALEAFVDNDRPSSTQISGLVNTKGRMPSDESRRVRVQTSGVDVQWQDELRGVFGLTTMQARVAILLADRNSNREIAAALCVTEHTARRHTEKVLDKLRIHSRTEVRDVLRRGPCGTAPSGMHANQSRPAG